jgi:predicted dehydrogenase
MPRPKCFCQPNWSSANLADARKQFHLAGGRRDTPVKQGNQMSLKVAIAGTGNIGHIHATAVQNTPGLTLHAAVDNQPDRLAAFAEEFKVPHQYTSLDELLKSGSLDVLVIGVPNYLHAPFAISALQAGIAVMVEKPMAMNAGEAQQMAEASHKSGAALMVAHCWRFDEEVLWLKQQVLAGKLGKIIRSKGYGVHVHWGPSGWFTQKNLAGGGALADMGVHAIDTARFLIGDADTQPVSVFARLGTYYQAMDVDDTGVILITWDNGATSYIESGWWQPHSDGPEAGTQLYGTTGFGQVFPTCLELPNAREMKIERTNPGFPFPRPENGEQKMYNAQMAYFAECIRSGQTPQPGSREGLVNMKIIDAAYTSARTGKVVEL